MEVFFHISWRRSSIFCNQSVIDSGNLIGQSANIDCHGCSASPIANVTFMCTDYSIEDDWSFGERRFVYAFNEGPNITIAFTSGDWIRPFNSDWSILTIFSMARRSDTGRINSTPRPITTPLLRLQENCNHTIRIPVTDPDNDIVRCRWAVGYDECGSICDSFPEADLDPDSCSITYTADQGVGYRAAAIIIEDFLPGSTVPMSSVALQFLVLVFNSTRPCSDTPEFIPPTLEDDSCVVIPPGGTFHTMLVAVSSDIITEFQTVSPAGMEKSDLFQKEISNIFYVNITWTPTTDQENAHHLFCYTAISSTGISSIQVCIELLPGYNVPAPIPETAVPNMGSFYPCDTTITWNVIFDKDVERSSTSAYITFHEFDTDVVVHRIDTSSSSEVVFVNGSMIALTPDHIFQENEEYYINFDRGVVIAVEGCKPGNEPVTGRQFWTIKTLNKTSPERPGKVKYTNILGHILYWCIDLRMLPNVYLCISALEQISVTTTGETTLDCKCETPVDETPDYKREGGTSCTTPLIIGIVVGIIGLLVGASGLIIACVTIKQR